jgi:ATP-dependent phosphofructokinase / diphosphate-dependent phosphofructokinase
MEITRRLHEELDLPAVGVPKTIDNDVVGTDFTFGFDTAVQVATDALDRLHTTAQSHDRIMIVEVMGRNVGWLAMHAGLAGGADGIVIPELTLTVEDLAATVERRHERGKNFSIIVVAEGAELAFASGERQTVRASESTDAYGYPQLGGIGDALATELARATGYEARVTTLGHVQRGGTPSSTDRILATRYGIQAAGMVIGGETGRMAALQGNEMTSVPLSEVRGLKQVDLRLLEVARTFFT